AQSLDVLRPQRDRAAPGGAAGAVGEADEALALFRLEELNERGEALVTHLLGQRDLLEKLSGSPGRRDPPLVCCHVRQHSAYDATCLCQLPAETATRSDPGTAASPQMRRCPRRGTARRSGASGKKQPASP